MRCQLAKVNRFCGQGCTIYTVKTAQQDETLFEGFLLAIFALTGQFKREYKYTVGEQLK